MPIKPKTPKEARQPYACVTPNTNTGASSPPNRPAPRKTTYTRTVYEARSGDIWVGTRGGLLQYSESGDTFRVYKKIKNNPESMSENTAFCIYEDADGNIWCGTYGGGLNKLDVRSGKFKHYTTADGLLNNNVFSLLPDKKGNLWLLGYNGISKFNPANETF